MLEGRKLDPAMEGTAKALIVAVGSVNMAGSSKICIRNDLSQCAIERQSPPFENETAQIFDQSGYPAIRSNRTACLLTNSVMN